MNCRHGRELNRYLNLERAVRFCPCCGNGHRALTACCLACRPEEN